VDQQRNLYSREQIKEATVDAQKHNQIDVGQTWNYMSFICCTPLTVGAYPPHLIRIFRICTAVGPFGARKHIRNFCLEIYFWPPPTVDFRFISDNYVFTSKDLDLGHNLVVEERTETE
jgi:hypothetical protein